jgi:hypothetical protein
MKNDTTYKFYPNHEYVGKKRETRNFFNKNMTIFSKENKFIGMDKENNIALNYPASDRTFFADWEYDFEQYKALNSYAGSIKEDLINNGSIANLIYQLPLESDSDFYQISRSNFVDRDVFTSVVTNTRAKAALTEDGRIKIWGHHDVGGIIFSGKNKSHDVVYDDGAPDLNQPDFVEIYPHFMGFSAIKEDNSVIYWGMGKPVKPEDRKPSHLEKYEGFEEVDRFEWPTYVTSKVGDDFSKVYVNHFLFFGIQNGSVKVWHSNYLTEEQSTLALTEEMQKIANISNIHIAGRAVTLENKYGELYWIPTDFYENPKLQKIENPGFTKIYSNDKAFAGITAEGRIQSWGKESCGGSYAPGGSGYIAIYTTYCSFVAVRADGTYSTWGEMGEKRGRLSPLTIEITPQLQNIDYHPDSANLQFSVDYNVSDGEKDINSLILLMHYDSSKLAWKGVRNNKNNTVLGLSGGAGSANDIKADLIKEWSYSEFGELNNIKDRQEITVVADGDKNTNRLVGFMWGVNYLGGATFDGFGLGFVGHKKYPVKLFTTNFTVNFNALKDGEETRINLVRLDSNNVGDDYAFKPTSLIITRSGSKISTKIQKRSGP